MNLEKGKKMNEIDFNTPQWQKYFKTKSPEEIENFKKLLEELQGKTTKGKEIWFKDKEDGTFSKVGIVDDEVSVVCFDYKYFIQKIKYTSPWVESMGEEYGYRIGYYTIDAKKTKILWGQYASQIPAIFFKELIEKTSAKFFS